MSRTKMNHMATPARAWQRARETAPTAAAQVKPLASETKAAAGRSLLKARTWAAPQLERTGQVLQDKVAPKVSAALSESARRINPETPDNPGRRSWRLLAGISALLAAAAAVTAARRRRATPDAGTGEEAAPVRANAKAH